MLARGEGDFQKAAQHGAGGDLLPVYGDPQARAAGQGEEQGLPLPHLEGTGQPALGKGQGGVLQGCPESVEALLGQAADPEGIEADGFAHLHFHGDGLVGEIAQL